MTIILEYSDVIAMFGCKNSSQNWSTNCRFSGLKGLDIIYSHRSPKRTSWAGSTHFDVFCVEIPFKGVGCGLIQETSKNERTSHIKRRGNSRIWGAKPPEPIATKFCLSGVTQDIITHANFDKRLRGFGVTGGQILAFSIDLLRRP